MPTDASPPIRVAVCFAGAWRGWPRTYDQHIRPNIVDSLAEQHHRVDLFAVGDNLPWSPKNHRPDVRYNRTWNPEQMRELFGAEHFRAGELLSEEHMVNVSSHTWPEIAHAQAVLDEKSRRMKSPGSIPFAYVYKIWRCGQLIHRSGVAYDVVIRMRPDLWPIRPFKLARAADGRFELQVGGRCVRFGSREVVVHALTNYCANDWLAIGTLDTMTVTMDLARFWTPASAFLSTDAALQQIFRIGVEPVLNFLWWRTGTKVLRRPLFVEIARLRCADPSCLRLPAWQLVPILQLPDAESKCTVLPSGKRSIPGVLQRGKYGMINDCGAVHGRGDLEWFSGPTPGSASPGGGSPQGGSFAGLKEVWKPSTGDWRRGNVSELPREPPRTIFYSDKDKPTWARPDCGDVADLAVHNPLPPCKKVTGDEADHRPEAHRPRVLQGYGVPMVFDSPRILDSSL